MVLLWFSFQFLEDLSSFCRAYWCHSFGPLGFKARVVCFSACIDSLDSPLVRHLLTSWWPTLQPSFFHPRSCTRSSVGGTQTQDRAVYGSVKRTLLCNPRDTNINSFWRQTIVRDQFFIAVLFLPLLVVWLIMNTNVYILLLWTIHQYFTFQLILLSVSVTRSSSRAIHCFLLFYHLLYIYFIF